MIRRLVSSVEISRTIFNFAWAAIGQLVNVLIALGSLKVWTAYLTSEQLGLMGLTVGLSSLLFGIFCGPLLQVVLVMYSETTLSVSGKDFRAVTSSLLVKRVFAVVFGIVVVGLPVAQIYDLHWATVILVAVLFMADAYRGYEEVLFAARSRQSIVALLVVGDSAFRLTFVWMALRFVESNALLALAGNCIGAILFLCVLRILFPLESAPGSKRVDRDLFDAKTREIVSRSRPLLPATLLNHATETSTRYILAAVAGLSASGLYIICYGLVKRPYGILSHIISMTMTPVLSRAISEERADAVLIIKLVWVMCSLLPSVFGAWLFERYNQVIVDVLLSEEYQNVGPLLVCLAFAITICNVNIVINSILAIHKVGYGVLKGSAAGCLVTVAATFLLGASFGIEGAIWALSFGYGAQLIVLLWVLTNNARSRASLKRTER